MNFYLLKMSLNGSQSVIMDQLKSNGSDVIQTSDGLCFKSDKSAEELKKLIGPEYKGNIESIDVKSIDSLGFSEDVKAFIHKIE